MRTLAWLAVTAVLGVPAVCDGQQVALRRYTTADGLAHNSVTRVFQDSRGYLWFATVDGVSRFDGHAFVTYRSADGLPNSIVTAIGETNGVLWLAARGGQAVRASESSAGPSFLPYRPPTPIDTAERLRVPASMHRRLFEDRPSAAAPVLIRGTTAAVTDILEDESGTAWIATSGAGVFSAPAEIVVNYTAADELPDEHIVRILEAHDGRIYAMTRRGGVAELREDGVEALAGSLFAPFDTIGRRIGQDENAVWWFRTDSGFFSAPGPALSFSRARLVTDAPIALPHAQASSFTDSRGWIWEPLPERGVSLCHERGCIDYSQGDGIGQLVTSMAEDAFGRIYFGTARGLIRFEPHIRKFSPYPSGVKLAGSSVTDCMRDSRGRLWVATTSGASYIVPRQPRSRPAPQVYLTGLRAGDVTLSAPPVAATTLGTFEARAGVKQVLVEYGAPGASNSGARYQHRLMPRDEDWTAPRGQRAATYSSLPPGAYTFEVRAVGADGTAGPAASVRFRIVRPFWTWWWVAAAAGVALAGRRALRQLQRANRRRDLAGVPLRVFGGVEEQTEDGGRHAGPSDGPRLVQR